MRKAPYPDSAGIHLPSHGPTPDEIAKALTDELDAKFDEYVDEAGYDPEQAVYLALGCLLGKHKLGPEYAVKILELATAREQG